MHLHAAILEYFAFLGLSSTLGQCRAVVGVREYLRGVKNAHAYALIAAISGLMPTMFNTRVRL